MSQLAFSANVDFDKMVSNRSSYDTLIDPVFLERLNESCNKVDGPVHAKFSFYSDLQGLRTIEGTLDAKVVLTCQRCGREFVKELHSSFISTCDEAKARSLKIDEKLDIVELNDDGSFNLLGFLEDCLLLEMPFVPAHDEDSEECDSNRDWSFGKVAEDGAENPFAKLAQLKDSFKK
ncbi:MAG: YceD family protein [Succinivibrio sp.]